MKIAALAILACTSCAWGIDKREVEVEATAVGTFKCVHACVKYTGFNEVHDNFLLGARNGVITSFQRPFNPVYMVHEIVGRTQYEFPVNGELSAGVIWQPLDAMKPYWFVAPGVVWNITRVHGIKLGMKCPINWKMAHCVSLSYLISF